MNTDSQGNRIRSLLRSILYASTGIQTAIKQENNLRFHLVSAVVVIGFASIFSISKQEWIILIFLIGGMFAMELMNTAIERVVDLVTTDFHPLAKQAKDIAAGAVLVFAIVAAVIGMMIFIPHFLKILGF